MTAETRVSVDADALARETAGWIVERTLAGTGRFALNLSGGSTPKALYALLAQPPLRDRMPWARVHLFWGDATTVFGALALYAGARCREIWPRPPILARRQVPSRERWGLKRRPRAPR